MALRKKLLSLPLLFAMGMLSFSYGLGAAYVENHFSKPTVIISLIGLVCILICFFELRKFTKKSARASQWKKYGFIAFVIVLLLAFLVGINYLAYRYNLRWDIT